MQNRIFSLIAILCLLTAASGWSQETRGNIVGRVLDPSGAVIPGAQVVVTSTAMGNKVTLTTNAEGFYRALLLPAGLYQLEVSAQGFKKAVKKDVEVRIADRLEIDVPMEIGASDQSVTVTSEVPLLNAETASLGNVVDSKRVASLPVSYGNPFLLIGLSAGVTFNGGVRNDRPFEPTHIVNFSMGGTRGNLNDITIDGAPTTATANAFEVSAAYVPPTDIVQEFKVQTATFDAQFGQTQGGVTNISIKSGTNQFHGDVRYQFYRPALWANDWFNNFAGKPKNPFKLDTWGGAVGGPVFIPKVYNGKNKTFFMFGYEGMRDSRPRHDDTTNTIPTPAMHNGDFSALLAGGGAAYTIYNPYSRTGPNAAGRYTQTPFPENKIAPQYWDPVGVKLLNFYPMTEKTPGDPVGLNNYRDNSLAEATKYYNFTVRADQIVSDKQRFFVRLSQYIRNSTYNNYFNSEFMGQQFWFYAKAGMFDHVYTLSPSLILNTRYSYNRFIRGTEMPPGAVGYDLSKLGFSQQFISQVPKDLARVPRVNLTGYIGNGVGGEERPVNNHTVSATVTKSAGKHSIRSGFEYRVYQEADHFFGNAQTVQFTFDATYTRGPLDNASASPSSIGQSVAALLIGRPGSASISRSADYVEQSGSWGFFVQDDFKVTPKLTLNLGLRYEFETPLHERFNRSTLGFDTSYTQDINAAAQAAYAAIYPTITFPELPASALVLKGGMTFAGQNGNSGGLYKTPKNVFMPRFGLSYQLSSNTVIRTGGGMFAGFLGERRGDVYQNGFSQTTNMVQTNDNGLTWLTTIANPFPNGVSEPKGNADGLKTYLGQGFSYFTQDPKIPLTMRWEFGVQHEFKGFVLETNYVGSKTNHIEITRNINALPRKYWSTMQTRDDTWNNYLTATFSNPMYNLVPGNSQGTYTSKTISRQTLLSPYPAFGANAINNQENTGYSWYHSLQISLQKRFSKGYTIQGSYTLSKWMQAVNLLNSVDLAPIREISDADSPHRFNISGVWELPFGKGKALLASGNGFVSRLVGGWQASGIWNFQSGFPLAWNNVIDYQDPSLIRMPLSERTPEHWFNITGIETVSNKQLLSNQLRTWPLRFATLRRQRMNNVDLALIKDTRITEGTTIQFRAEALNACNHPYFPSPNMTITTARSITDSGFGQISASSTDNYARRLQLSLRLNF